jgi:parvulin-like peptidyl-prolyl isomerase
VNYQSVRISGAAESSQDADGNTVDPTDDEIAAALQEAKAAADAILADYEAGGSLETLAEDNDNAAYTNGKNASYYDSVLLNWLFDSSRKDGDAAVLSDEDNSAYYVAVFTNRFRPEFDVQDVRHILIQPESGEKSEGDDGYEAEQAQLKADAKAKAEELLAQYQAGDATEDAFAALAVANSADSSASNGGLISGVSEISSYVEPFLNWCIDSSRKPGDTGIVESDYGYHIMYFVGNEEPYWKSRVTSALTSNDYTEWYEAATADASYEQTSGIRYVG